ncbi:MAG TPA: radical SAM protein, partial [Polyangia bacterium]
MRVLLVTPPMTQLNTPYPATAYLTGCLRKHAAETVEVAQADLSIELFLRLFSRDGLAAAQAELQAARGGARRSARGGGKRFDWFVSRAETYAGLVEPVVRFLQGHDPSLAMRIAGRAFLPEGPRFAALDAESGDGEELLGWAFGALGVTDRARHLASLFIDDLADVIRDGIDPRFELSRYGEKLASSAARFDPLADALDAPPTLVDRLLDELARDCVRAHAPDVVGLTVPFPGNLYGALRIARVVKAELPAAKV